MRLWHYRLLPYLPDAQFKGQLRELVAIMRDWRDNGSTNHLLINRIMEYSKNHLVQYFFMYEVEYHKRYGKHLPEISDEFTKLIQSPDGKGFLGGWHNKEYLRVCMANLYEKHVFGIGNSRITGEEWQRITYGYKAITGEFYQL